MVFGGKIEAGGIGHRGRVPDGLLDWFGGHYKQAVALPPPPRVKDNL